MGATLSERFGPNAAEAMRYMRRPLMPAGVRFALFPSLHEAVKPVAFADLAGLARRIHRERRNAAIELADRPIWFRPHDAKQLLTVRVYILDAGGDPQTFVGTAYLDGGDRRALQAALRANEPAVVA